MGLCSVSDLEEAIETIKKQLIDSINTASRGVVDTHSVTDSTTYDEFEKILARIKKDFSNNTYKKIVVARERTYEIPADFDSVSLFKKWRCSQKTLMNILLMTRHKNHFMELVQRCFLSAIATSLAVKQSQVPAPVFKIANH